MVDCSGVWCEVVCAKNIEHFFIYKHTNTIAFKNSTDPLPKKLSVTTSLIQPLCHNLSVTTSLLQPLC